MLIDHHKVEDENLPTVSAYYNIDSNPAVEFKHLQLNIYKICSNPTVQFKYSAHLNKLTYYKYFSNKTFPATSPARLFNTNTPARREFREIDRE